MAAQIIKEDPRLISFNMLRKAVGWLGVLLPLAMLAGNLFFSHCHFIRYSISHYYYTITGDLFVGILCAVALFLLSYKGYPDDKRDNIFSSLAGIFALGIAFFPTNNDINDNCAILQLKNSGLRNGVHFGCAALFFIMLAYMSYFLFTKSKGHKTGRKVLRNKIYRACGVLIIVFLGLIILYSSLEKNLASLARYKPVFWLEWFALAAFGTSWLIKGELLLRDDMKQGH